jgi:hypothetical protein
MLIQVCFFNYPNIIDFSSFLTSLSINVSDVVTETEIEHLVQNDDHNTKVNNLQNLLVTDLTKPMNHQANLELMKRLVLPRHTQVFWGEKRHPHATTEPQAQSVGWWQEKSTGW